MPTPFPESVRDTLGDEGAEDLVRWLDDYLQERTVHRDEFREVLSRLDVLGERVSQLEERMDQRFEQVDQRFEQVDKRFEQVDKRFEQVDRRFEQIDQRFQQVNDRFGQMDGRLNGINQRLDDLQEQMRRQIRSSGGTIALFGTIITVLIAVAEFAG